MSKTNYRVAPGVTEINGQRVPQSGQITLSPAEAMFDLAHGRISLGKAESVSAIDLVVPPESDIAPVPDPIAAPVTRSRAKRRRP